MKIQNGQILGVSPCMGNSLVTKSLFFCSDLSLTEQICIFSGVQLEIIKKLIWEGFLLSGAEKSVSALVVPTAFACQRLSCISRRHTDSKLWKVLKHLEKEGVLIKPFDSVCTCWDYLLKAPWLQYFLKGTWVHLYRIAQGFNPPN